MLQFVAEVLQVCCNATKLILFYHFTLSVIKLSFLEFCEILCKIFYVLHKKDGCISSRLNLIIQLQILQVATDPVLRPRRMKSVPEPLLL